MNFHFATPWLLILLVLVPLLALLPRWAGALARPAGLRFAHVALTGSSARSWRLTFRRALPGLRLLALALVIVAVARPQTGEAREIIRGEGVDIALALDISGSMASLDFEPRNRLEAAKQVIGEFIEEREHDRIGLVVFANDSFIQSPPTIDHSVLQLLLADIQLAEELRIEDGTAIGLGLASAANMLKDSTAESKVIILLTDGANNSGEIDPVTAAIAIEALGIKVHTIGAGRPGRVLVPRRGFFGTQSVFQESDLDEDTLTEIAETTGGQYFRATDTAGLRQVYDEIDSLERSEIDVQIFTRYTELAGWLLVPGLILLVLELMLRNTALRRIP
jgi:Ca-activated chloride channel family protein